MDVGVLCHDFALVDACRTYLLPTHRSFSSVIMIDCVVCVSMLGRDVSQGMVVYTLYIGIA